MRDVIEQLRSYAEAAEDAVPDATPVAPRPRRGRVVLAMAAALVVIAAVGGAIALQQDDELPVTSGTEDPSVPEGGRWDELPAAPIAGRTGHVMVATDDELIVWGGYRDGPLADGAAWSFEDESWRALAPSPLAPRSDAIAVWTGREVIVLGGRTATDIARDGAAYDPAADSWRLLPEAPFDADAQTGAVWTGTDLVLIGVRGKANEFLPSDTYALRLGWEALPPMPGEGNVRAVKAIWTGAEALVVAVDDRGPVTIRHLEVDDGADRWGATAMAPMDGLDVEVENIVWTGDRLLATDRDQPGFSYDPGSGALDAVPPSATAVSYPAQLLGDVVSVGDRFFDGRSWRDAADIPGDHRGFPATAVHDGRLYVWGGNTGCGPGAECAEFNGPSDGLVWRPPGPATSPTTSTSAPSQPSIPGEAAFDLYAEVTCGPTDATEVMVELRAGRRLTVIVEVVPYEEEAATILAGPKSIELPAETDVADFVSFNVRVDELQAAGRPLEVRVEDEATGELRAVHVIPMQTPSCG